MHTYAPIYEMNQQHYAIDFSVKRKRVAHSTMLGTVTLSQDQDKTVAM